MVESEHDAMKRHGNLWPELISMPHLREAARKACRGKRYRPDVLEFHYHLESNLLHLQKQLQDRTYLPGGYRTFTILEPKPRLISAAPYRDRVVHHALVGILEPIYEKCFIHDSYASRVGKGTHLAMRRCQEFLRQYPYAWKADIRKFFPSLDHEVLKTELSRKIKDSGVLWLAGKIIEASNPQEEVQDWFPGDHLFTPTERKRGIPIGNQSSQFFANVYLSPMDHFIKDELRAKGYVRYVDDFVVFAESRDALQQIRREVKAFLEPFRLRVHPQKDAVFPSSQGVRFLGFRVKRSHVELQKSNVLRFRRRLRRMQKAYFDGTESEETLLPRIMSWIGHAMNADTFRLRERLFAEHPFRRSSV